MDDLSAPFSSENCFRLVFLAPWAVVLLLVGVAFHVIYEGIIVRRANPMAVSRTEARRILVILENFFGLSNSYPRLGKYHPGQIFFHWLVAGNFFFLTLTGFIIWKPLRDLLPLSLLGFGWDFIFYNRLLHGFFSATLIASLFAHIYFAVLIKKNWKEAKSMFTGRIPFHEYLRCHHLDDSV
ncbi:MAG TPA: cytochrome b/b6 domain-containing protein [Thermodesulfobacteriota bacterium]|nr:cytochrome b/b6 domain-containing protein [Thermodesulfobacteriota bacterium]